MSVQEVKVKSEKEAISFLLKEKFKRGEKGWSFLPYDDPNRGLTGVVMYFDHCPLMKKLLFSGLLMKGLTNWR